MKQVSLTVNGEAVRATVEPRTHLADFLRSELGLTGTHLGCEQGVCGACTVLIDGKPVRTIEGFGDDPTMQRLREAFAAHHGLQCGYCTSGMLITSRDIVERLGAADESRIRLELSGNLCRCTGYVGIVAALKSVLAEREVAAADSEISHREPAGRAAAPTLFERRPGNAARQVSSATPDRADAAPLRGEDKRKGWTVLVESFDVPYPPDDVWTMMQNVPDVAACMPGTEVVAFDGVRLRARVRVKFGPMSVEFEGEGTVEADAAARRGVISGEGADRRNNSRVKAIVTYTLTPDRAGASTHIDVRVEMVLTGMLAQFSRSGLVKDLARRLTAEFAQRLAARLSGSEPFSAPTNEPAEINAITLVFSLLWQRLKSLLAG